MLDAYFHLDASASDPLADLERRLAVARVERVLVVETWAGKERPLLDQLATRDQERKQARGVAYCYRGQDKEGLAAALGCSTVRALRMKTTDLEFAPDWLRGQLNDSGHYLLCHGELGIARLTRALSVIVGQHPALRIYVPHLGWPRRDKVDDADWTASIAALTALPNVVMGVSGLASFSRTVFPHEDVQPLARRAIDAFGPERLVAATDYPNIDQPRYTDYYHLARKWITDRWPNWSDDNALRP